MTTPIWGIPPDTEIHPGVMSLASLWHMPDEVWGPIWQRGITGRTIKVAVLDTGFKAHPALPNPVATKSFVAGESVTDRHGHGTHCAGTVLGRGGLGCAPDADLIVGKVLSNGGSGSSQGIAAGIEWAIDANADVISMSLGGGQSYGPTNRAIDRAYSKGSLVVAAAGNSGYRGSNTVGWPAKYTGCLCVGATQRSGEIANFSSGGKELDCATPGQDIVSCGLNNDLRSMSGTSMATPGMAGRLALIVQLMRQEGSSEWTAVDAVREFLRQWCEDRGAPGHDPRFGWGVPKDAEMLKALAEDDIQWV